MTNILSIIAGALRKRKIANFSLIELIIVIAIIAIPAGMLLPALNSAREKARCISCLSNYKQVGQILAQYRGDNHEYLPYYKWSYGGTEQSPNYYHISDLSLAYGVKDPLTSRRSNLWTCPNYNGPQITVGSTTGFNSTMLQPVHKHPAPSKGVEASENKGHTLISWEADKDWSLVLYHENKKKCNMVMLDGHGESRAALQIPSAEWIPTSIVSPSYTLNRTLFWGALYSTFPNGIAALPGI